jgi:hypothetical protein
METVAAKFERYTQKEFGFQIENNLHMSVKRVFRNLPDSLVFSVIICLKLLLCH